jgi:DNA repair exonuclease SbcCD ATPase subunit
MNCRISDVRLRGVCRELLRTDKPVTHRVLRQILRERFGATGKTARVLKVWREESERCLAAKTMKVSSAKVESLPADIQELRDRLTRAEAHAAEQTARAERAEYREQAHQDHWAMEIDRLREEQRARPQLQGELRALQEQVLRLTAELNSARALLTRHP